MDMLLSSASGVDELRIARENWLVATALLHDQGRHDSNIPIDESISAAITKLEQHKDDVDMLGLTVADVQLMLQYVLSNNYFEFNSKQYRQKRGIAMGNHLAPPLAILFMDALEQKALSTATVKPDLYKRYIDDCILLWRHGWKG